MSAMSCSDASASRDSMVMTMPSGSSWCREPEVRTISRRVRLRTSGSKRHQNHNVASVLSIPKFAQRPRRMLANFGIGTLVAGLAVEGTVIAPVGELRARALRIKRARQLGEDAAQIAFGLVALARQRPAFGEPGQVFAAVVQPEPREGVP